MPEPDPIKRVDDLAGDVGDRLGERPLAGQELVGAVRELALGLRWIALQVEGGEQLDQPPVEEDPRRERGGVERRGRAATRRSAWPAGTRGCASPAARIRTNERSR